MIKSMTGFASGAHDGDHATVSVTIRSVNHRHLDLQLRVPQALAEAEMRIRAAVQRHIGRGRVELAVNVAYRHSASVEVEFNEPLAVAVAAALESARSRGIIQGALSPGDLLRLPQALSVREHPVEKDATVVAELAAALDEVVEEALVKLDAMRATEGGLLNADLEARRAALGGLLEDIAEAAEEGRLELQARLAARVLELAAELPADGNAVAQEIVRTAARSDISEETSRFRAHLSHWHSLAQSDEPCGRKLDFLLQEMNREVNTIGSKADGLRVSNLVIAAKAELEKMREQVQNVE
jgi:uncharacterized protein (TIGR00255 family)